jgi:archaellum biogenesis ATPase FlaH
MAFEKVILSNLIFNVEYGRKVIPFLREDYFHNVSDKVVFKLIDKYVLTYGSFPSQEAMLIDLSGYNGLNEEVYRQCTTLIDGLKREETDLAWLVDNTEKFCKDKALYNAIMQSIQVMDDDTSLSRGAIPQLLTDALSVSFDTHIGHDFFEDSEERYAFYHKKENKIPFDLEYLNRITMGGLSSKTLSIILAGTGVGKSLAMCHFAAANIAAGYNVLYITMEMAEERIAERIDANLLNFTIDELAIIPKDVYDTKINRVKAKAQGKLIIKEYPTACAGAANFRHLLNELKIKKNFRPDIIYIDYLNICMSSRIKFGANVNSYTYIKSIAEELRGLAVEYDVPVVSATQTTRGGYSNSDPGLEDTSESFGLPATADLMFAIISSEELEALNQVMFKQLKNRYSDINKCRRFVVGIDRPKMRLYDVEQDAQDDIYDGPVMDNTTFGREEAERSKPKKKYRDFK